ncbi:hypothetical protein CP157_03981 (plasmid) [Paracoccus marcusii]|mgnify:CR=1 FL=1|uniref:hypothetical protein n=1 Tax=Paracoccus marcusii TaxID=59779 RepID=UPI001C3DD2A5|nr:hypothetical protein [Paracoccus marcusii]QXI66189.1 hypothetical protein CP157_03981 [Paracoccus marcusii]
MIEIGKRYRLTTLGRDEGGYYHSSDNITVTGLEGNLLEVNGYEIVNMASPLFHALLDEEGQQAAYKQAEENFLKKISSEDLDPELS